MTEFIKRCELCGERRAAKLFDAFGYPIMKCGECGLVHTGNLASSDAIVEYYRNGYYETAVDYARSLTESMSSPSEDHCERVQQISRLVGRRSGSVLDIGCGAGSLLATFKTSG